MFSIRWIGVGSAFCVTDAERGMLQSSFVVEAESGKRLLVDCGTTAPQALKDAYGITAATVSKEIDAIYLTHSHADHVGGMEWLGFSSHFIPGDKKIDLYCNENLIQELWAFSLRGGMETLQGDVATLTTFFSCHSVPNNGAFVWEDILFKPVQAIHVASGLSFKLAYGLMMQQYDPLERKGVGEVIYFTSDTQFCPEQIKDFYKMAHIIFHDCETSPYRSRVHAHYDDLKQLPEEIKAKMWLFHYQPNPEQDPVADGFLGFLEKGQEFSVHHLALTQ